MIKRVLTLVNAKQGTVLPHITASVFINDDAGPRTGCRRAPKAAWAAKRSRGARHHQRPTGRLRQLAEIFGTWERILCQLDGG